MDRLDAMQIFIRVAEAGSFSAVAHELQSARSVVTRQIAGLEKRLGVRLITRSTRSLTLTKAGASYLESCRTILNMVDTAESNLSGEGLAAKGRIRVGLPLLFGMKEIVPLLLSFARRHPEIELVMTLSDERSNLIEEGLDLSLRITSHLNPSDIVRKLGQCRLLTLASSTYLKTHGRPQHPQDLRDHQCLIYAHDASNSQWMYRERKRILQVSVHGRIVANNGIALTEAAALGMGITRQPDFVAAPYLEKKRVEEILNAYEPEPLGIYAVLPSNRYVPHRVRLLIEDLASAMLARPAKASLKTT
jgi:DNA-binding transcriptional LysR family regulator